MSVLNGLKNDPYDEFVGDELLMSLKYITLYYQHNLYVSTRIPSTELYNSEVWIHYRYH